jgi:tRNA-(ms[2]io[6]A)-hydroxylase
MLLSPTPAAWFAAAGEHWQELLLDHANCEKKAASTALALMFSYAEDTSLALRLSRLAREELRHFEQVQKLLRELGVPHQRLSPSRYAEGLRRCVRSREPERRLDLLLVGALIEMRSCERFAGLVPRFDEPLRSLYDGLRASEARHGELYLQLAEAHASRSGCGDAAQRLAAIAVVESELATAPDPLFRFHSGTPVSPAH